MMIIAIAVISLPFIILLLSFIAAGDVFDMFHGEHPGQVYKPKVRNKLVVKNNVMKYQIFNKFIDNYQVSYSHHSNSSTITIGAPCCLEIMYIFKTLGIDAYVTDQDEHGFVTFRINDLTQAYVKAKREVQLALFINASTMADNGINPESINPKNLDYDLNPYNGGNGIFYG